MDAQTPDLAVRTKKPSSTLAGQPLTRREAEVAALVGDGQSNREIAERLGISEQTVKNHLTSIYDKTAVGTRVQLALLWARGGMPEPPTH